MNTPIYDFVKSYAASGTRRLHMPGHKGRSFLGCESLDITEVKGADALYEAAGIIAESERNASALFGSGRTLYSTEGSSQCIRAMLYLALERFPKGQRPLVVAARNVHKAFVYAAALLDLEVLWLYPDRETVDCGGICSCPIGVEQLRQTLAGLAAPPLAVYVTSPDYLGGQQDIAGLSQVCEEFGTLLLCDNAHGAYLHFLNPSLHPLDLGAAMTCDSAHKTFPVLTGGAYLHLSRKIAGELGDKARAALALFGSTSPSYLILSSLDLCNAYLANDYKSKLNSFAEKISNLKVRLASRGLSVEDSDPLKLTIGPARGRYVYTIESLAQALRRSGAEFEFCDGENIVMMLTPENGEEDLEFLERVLGEAMGEGTPEPEAREGRESFGENERALSIREAVFSPSETVMVSEALGRICAAPTVSCPPAIPIAISGEIIGERTIEIFRKYGLECVEVVK